MESLDLNGLAKSLPASNFEKAEKDLLNNFKGESPGLVAESSSHVLAAQLPHSASQPSTGRLEVHPRERTMRDMQLHVRISCR